MSPARRRLTVTLWSVLLLAALWQALQTPVATDMSLFMPRAEDATQEMLLEELRAGPAARLLLLGLEGAPPEVLAETSNRLAEALAASDLLLTVGNGGQGIDPALGRRLWDYRYLLSPALSPDRFTVEGLRDQLQARVRELALPLPPFDKARLPADPTLELPAVLAAWRGINQPPRRQGVWFAPDGSRALLLARTRAFGTDLEGQEAALDLIRRTFATLAPPGVELVISGPGVFATQARDTIRRDAQWLSLLASLGVILLLWLAYRNWRPLVLGIIPLVGGITLGVAVVGLVFGGIHGITLAFGVTLLGVAIDYPIHLFSHLEGGRPVAGRLAAIWPTLRLGVVTTVLGYLAMVGSSLAGLSQLGVFATAGLLAAAALTRWLLPALLPRVWSPARPRLPARLLAPFPRLARIVALAGLGALVLVLVAPPAWESDLEAISPVPAPARLLDRELRGQLAAPEVGHLLLIQAPGPEEALVRTEELLPRLQGWVDQGLMDGFEAAARYLPSQARQLERRSWLPSGEELAARLDWALAGLPFRAGVFQPFVEAVEQARQLPPLTPADLADDLLGLKVDSLLFEHRGHWVALLPLSGVRDGPALAREAAGVAGLTYLNIRQASNQLVADFRHQALSRLAWGALAMVVVLTLGLGWRALGRVVVPVGLALVLTLAGLSLLGERLSLFHLVALLLVIGIGIDYALFFARLAEQPDDAPATLHALLVCATSTVLVFGMLATSSLPVLSAIGLTAALGVAASLLTAGTLSRHRFRSVPSDSINPS